MHPGYHQPAHFIGAIPQDYHQPMTNFGAIPPMSYHAPAQDMVRPFAVQNAYGAAPNLGNCAPCQAAQMRGFGQATDVTFDWKRDAASAALAFAVPTLYHYKAPKKWRRFGPVGNVVAVIGLYFFYNWAYGALYAPKQGNGQ